MHPARQTPSRAPLPLLLLAVLLAVLAANSRAADAPRAGADAGAALRAQVPPQATPAPSPDARKRNHRTPLSASARWSIELPALVAGAPGYDQAHAYVPLQSGEVVAVALSNGTITWRAKVAVSGAAAAGGGLVFVPTPASLEALDAATGEPRWSVPIDSPVSAPLAWQNGWLLAGTDKGAAIMLRAASGERLWQRQLPGKLRAAPAMAGDRVYVPLESRLVLALALATGDTIWEQRLNGRPTTLAPLDDRLFAGADDKFFYCLSWRTGEVEWRWRTGAPVVGRTAIDESRVYFLSRDNVLRALDRGHGAQAWYAPLPLRPSAGPVLDAGLLIVSGLSEIRAFQVTDGTPAGSVEVPEHLAAAPHFLSSGGTLVSPFFVVTREGQARLLVPEPPPLPSKPLIVVLE